MRYCFLLLFAALTFGDEVIVSWRYSRYDIGGDLVFYVQHSPVAVTAISQWETASVITFTNPTPIADLPEYFEVPIQIERGAHFFVVTASNFWGTTNVQADISKPAVPVQSLAIRLK